MRERDLFGPYRIAPGLLVAALFATVGVGGAGLGGFAAEDEIPPAVRAVVVVAGMALIGLATWAFGSSTRADQGGLETRVLWRRTRIPWSRLQDIRIERSIEAEAMETGATAYTVVYDETGRRRRLPCLDNMNAPRRGLDLADEVAALRAAWLRLRGPDWTLTPEASANIADRERYGNPWLTAMYAGIGGLVAAFALLIVGFAIDAEEWGAPWSWPFGPLLPLLPATAFVYVAVRRITGRRRRIAAATARHHPAVALPGSATGGAALFRVTPGEIVLGVAASPDGTRVAVVSMPSVEDANVVREYAIDAPAEPLRSWSVDGPWVTDVLHLGDAIVIRVEEFMGGTRLVRCAGDTAESFGDGIPVRALRQVPGGFVGVAGDDVLALGTAHDDELRPLPLAAAPRGTDVWTLATDPEAGLLAFGGRELVILDAGTGALVARAAPPRRRDRIGEIAFAGPGRIVTQLGRERRDPNGAAVHHTLASWRLTGTALSFETSVPAVTWGSRWPAAIPACGLVVTAALNPEPHKGGVPQFRDAATLGLTKPPTASLTGLDGVTSLPPSPCPGLVPLVRRLTPDDEYDDTAEVHRASAE